jgi:type IV pilus assembly protein PilA
MALKLLLLLKTEFSDQGESNMAAILKSQRGFTLVEMAIIMAIISILAAMAITEYYNIKCKVKQSEAKKTLGVIAKYEEAYFSEYDTYSIDKKRIGFSMKGIHYYTYQIVSADTSGFVAKASATYKGRADSWVINEKLSLDNDQNACRR